MSRLSNSSKADQLDLFQPLRNRPVYRTLPPEVKQRMVPLLVRLLREYQTRQFGAVPEREVRDE